MSDEEKLARAMQKQFREWWKENPSADFPPPKTWEASHGHVKARLLYMAKLFLDGYFDDLLKRKE